MNDGQIMYAACAKGTRWYDQQKRCQGQDLRLWHGAILMLLIGQGRIRNSQGQQQRRRRARRRENERAGSTNMVDWSTDDDASISTSNVLVPMTQR